MWKEGAENGGLTRLATWNNSPPPLFLANMSLRAHQHGEQHTSEGVPTNMHTKAFTYTKLSRRLKEGGLGNRQTCWSNKSPESGLFFLRGGPKRLRRDLRQLTAVPTTEKKTATFSVVMLSKKKMKCKSSSVRKMLISSIPDPAGSFRPANTGGPGTRCARRGVGSGFFAGGKMWKMSRDSRCHVKATSYNSECSKWSTLLQRRPGSNIYHSDGNTRYNATSRRGITS